MKRVLTALLLVPVGIYSALFAPWPLFAAVIAAVACVSFHEYSVITSTAAMPFAILGYGAGLLVLLAPASTLPLILFLSSIAALCLPLAATDLSQAVGRAGMLVLGILYIFGAWRTAILMHAIPSGPYWLLFALAVNWVGDTGAYYIGRKWGKHKLAPVVSPGKSREGAAASVAAAVVLGLIYLPLTVPGISLVAVVFISVIANIAGQVGDLAESAVKRSAGVKDSGAILPGHGGMLDRLDSAIFTLPVLWAVLQLIG